MTAKKMRSSIVSRGRRSWRIKYEIGNDPVTGERRTAYESVRGTRDDAKARLIERLDEMAKGGHVEPSKLKLRDYAAHWLDAIAPTKTSPKTLERYRELIDKHIVPQLGETPLQKLDGVKIDAFYRHLRAAGRRDGRGGLAPQTVLHIHRLLSQVLASAVKANKLRQSPMGAVQTTPKGQQAEVEILDHGDLQRLYRHLKAKGSSLYMPVVLAGSTGLRRGEILGLRWADISLEKAELRVAQVVEQTRTGGLRFKAPKTVGSRRTITLPLTLVSELRAYRRDQAEWRMKNGLGKDPHDLVFPSWDGSIRDPNNFTREFTRAVAAAGVSRTTFHALRHTHITDLLRRGVPVHIVSKRAGHANPTITFNIYSHVMVGDDARAAQMVDEALAAALRE